MELRELRKEVIAAVRPYRSLGLYVEPLVRGREKVIVRAGNVYPTEVAGMLRDVGLDMERVEVRE